MQELDIKELTAFAAELVVKHDLKRVRISNGTIDVESWEKNQELGLNLPAAKPEKNEQRKSIYSLRR